MNCMNYELMLEKQDFLTPTPSPEKVTPHSIIECQSFICNCVSQLIPTPVGIWAYNTIALLLTIKFHGCQAW